MPSKAHASLLENFKDIGRLWDIHKDYAGGGVGYKGGVEILNRSAMVFISSCWEAFVEDLALEALDTMISSAASADAIPFDARRLLTDKLKEDKNKKAIWCLSGEGWKDHLRKNASEFVKFNFNTPNPEKCETLFLNVIGLKKGELFGAWRWRKMTVENAKGKLSKLVTVRGAIAHGRQEAPISKAMCKGHHGHIKTLAEKTDEVIGKHIAKELKLANPPW